MKGKAFQDPRDRFFLTVEAGAAGAAAGAGAGAGGGSGGSAGGASGAGAGGGGDPWYQPHIGGLDKDTLAYLDGKKFPTITDALKSGAQSDRMARERNVVMRPDREKLGEWEGWGLLGWDADKAKYGGAIKPPKQPNDAKHDEALFQDAVDIGHELKIPPSMVEGFVQKLSDRVNGRLSELAGKGIKDKDALFADLRKEWRDDYDVNMETAQRAARALGVGADELSELEAVVKSPRLLKMFAGLGKRIGEAGLVTGDGSGGGSPQTPAAAEAEMRRIEGDKDTRIALTDRRHPQHQDVKAKWDRLAAIAAGEKPRR